MTPDSDARPFGYRKIVITAALCFIGVAGGIYVGYELVAKEPARAPFRPDAGLGEKYLALEVGDLFPLEDYTGLDGRTGNFEQLLKNRPNVIFFVDFDCGPCHDLLVLWQKHLRDRLKPEVQVIACLEQSAGEIPIEYAALLDGMTAVFYDDSLWVDRYDLTIWPIVFGVDDSGFIKHI